MDFTKYWNKIAPVVYSILFPNACISVSFGLKSPTSQKRHFHNPYLKLTFFSMFYEVSFPHSIHPDGTQTRNTTRLKQVKAGHLFYNYNFKNNTCPFSFVHELWLSDYYFQRKTTHLSCWWQALSVSLWQNWTNGTRLVLVCLLSFCHALTTGTSNLELSGWMNDGITTF